MRYTSQAVGVIVIVVGLAALLASVGWHASFGETMGWLVPLIVLAAGGWILAEAVLRSRRSPAEGWGDRPDAPVASSPVPPPGATTWAEAAGTVPAEQPSGWSPAPEPAWSQWPETRPAGSAPSPEARPAGSPTAPVVPPEPAAPAAGSAWQPGPPGGTATGWGPAPGAAPAPGWQPTYPLEFRRTLGEIELAGPMSFGNARVETLLGEIRLDLTKATFPEGETTIHVSTGLGEVRVLVPSGMPVLARASTLLGETEALGRTGGSFMGSVEQVVDEPAGATRRLRVIAQAGIGAVAIRRERVPAYPGAPFTFGPPPAPAPFDAPATWPGAGQPAEHGPAGPDDSSVPPAGGGLEQGAVPAAEATDEEAR